MYSGFHPEILPRGGKIRYNGKLGGHVLCTLDLVKYTSTVLTHVMTSLTVTQCIMHLSKLNLYTSFGIWECYYVILHICIVAWSSERVLNINMDLRSRGLGGQPPVPPRSFRVFNFQNQWNIKYEICTIGCKALY